jgi:hypothetical protein
MIPSNLSNRNAGPFRIANIALGLLDAFSVLQHNRQRPNAGDDEPTPGIADAELLSMELALPRDGDGPELARVKRRKTDHNGVPIGRANKNPILDTRVFEVEFLDGHTAAMTANGIAENLFA